MTSFPLYEGKDVKVLGLNVINDLIKIDNNGAIIFVGLDEITFNLSGGK